MRLPNVLPRRTIEIVEIALSTIFCAVPAFNRVDPVMTSGPVTISGQWRYFSKVRDDTLSDDPDLNDGVGPRPLDEQLNAKSFFDLALTARLADRYNFRMGVNNILDTDPPIGGTNAAGSYGARVNAPFGNGNTFPQVYDAMGRYVFAGVTIDF